MFGLISTLVSLYEDFIWEYQMRILRKEAEEAVNRLILLRLE